MAHVFISYSYQDREFSGALCSFLEREGIRCWIAPRDVPVGERHPAAIARALTEASLVALLLSRMANGSEHVAREVCAAFEHKIPIVSVRIEDVRPQGALLYVLAGKHWLDLKAMDDADQLGAVLETVQRYLGTAAAPNNRASDDEAFRKVIESAHAGDPIAQHLLGRIRAERGKPTYEAAAAARWFRKAAEQGHAESAYQLSRAYENGEGVLKSQGEALRWMCEAAKLEDPRAQAKIGFHLLRTRSNDDSGLTEAANWFARAADQGSVDALYQLSVLRLEGRGVQQSDAEALKGFRELAQNGHSGAQYYFAWMLSRGRGTLANLEEARTWAERAASQGQLPPRALAPAFHKSFEGAVLECLQPRPEEPFRSASELLHALEVPDNSPSVKSALDTVSKESPCEWKIVLDVNASDVDAETQARIVEELRRLSGDDTLQLRRADVGSVVLVLEGTEEGYRVIENLFKSGQLHKVLGLTLQKVSLQENGSTVTGNLYESARNIGCKGCDLFVSYSHKDSRYLEKFVSHISVLQRQGLIRAWSDRQIESGTEWKKEIDEKLRSAHIIVLLV